MTDTTLPPLPEYVRECIRAYGDAREADDGTSAQLWNLAVLEMRKWGAASVPNSGPARPLTDAQKEAMWQRAYRENPVRHASFEWYTQGVEDAERAHCITAQTTKGGEHV